MKFGVAPPNGWGVIWLAQGNNDTTEDPMNTTYATFTTMLATMRKLTADQQRSLKAAAPAGFRRLSLYRNDVPTAARFAREHNCEDLWNVLAPVGEWMAKNVW